MKTKSLSWPAWREHASGIVRISRSVRRSFAIGVGLLVVAAVPAFATTITVTTNSGAANVASACTLRDAITAANTDAPVGGCIAGNGSDTIVMPMGAVITLSEVDNTTAGAGGLPVVSTAVAIDGNGATVQRDAALGCIRDGNPHPGEFRIFTVLYSGALTVNNLTVANGCVEEYQGGAGIYAGGGTTLSLNLVTLENNHVWANGGGLNVYGTTTITASAIRNNLASVGGGLSVYGGTTSLSNSEISGNSAQPGQNSGVGGGVFISNSAALSVVNSTISSNMASGANGGGGLYNTGTLGVSFTTIANNTASSGGTGGIYDAPYTGNSSRLKNLVVSGNAGNACYYPLTAVAIIGSNLSSDSTCTGFTLASTDPRLAPLGNNGGPAQTHTLLAGSPAIDAASDCTDVTGTAIVTTDQRGRARPYGAGCDLGAYERDDLIFANGFE